MDYSSPGSSVLVRIFQASMLEWLAKPSSGNLSNPGLSQGFLALQVNSLPSQPRGKYDKSNTTVIYFSLPYGILNKIFFSLAYFKSTGI